MGRNVEVKARLRAAAAVAAARRAAERLSGGPGCARRQHDTFFGAPRGRLKLRRCSEGPAELIFYERPDATGPKLSQYSISRTDDPEGLEAVLARALGVLGVVKKERLLYLVGQTRVHLDSVEGLGDFLELEVVLSEDQSPEQGELVAHELMKELGVEDGDLLTGAYLDLLLARGQPGS